MEQKGKTIVLNCEKLETRFALLNDGWLEEYRIERVDDEPKVGSIYLGRIVNLEPSLQAAFVDIGAERKAFLHYCDMIPESAALRSGDVQSGSDPDRLIPLDGRRSAAGGGETETKGRAGELKCREISRHRRKFTTEEIPEFFKQGMEILVQVVKAPIGSKGARVTANLSIAGRYLVLLPYADHIGLSAKIDNATERARLKKILSELELPDGMGLICRTVGEGRRGVFFKRDLVLLLSYWHAMESVINRGRAPLAVYREPDLVERTVRDFMTEEINAVVVDDRVAYGRIHDTVKRICGRKMASKVQCYESSTPIFDFYGINAQLHKVHSREVKLPGGGWICIDETEALIAIDVNSGRGRKNVEQPEFILKTNLEAAAEIARQLRLRNVGGLVVIDFIDMHSTGDRDELVRCMKKLVKDDRAKTKVLPISKFGLMEMTRQREEESIQDKVFDSCPYCGGSGRVKSPLTMSVEIQRRLNSILRDPRYKGIPVRIIMHPDVLARLKNEDSEHLKLLEQKYQHALSFRADPTLHCEEFQLIDPDTGDELR